MKTLYKTKRLSFVLANESDIPYIMSLEQHPENRKFVVQGTLDEHTMEIANEDYIVGLVREGYDKIGYMLCKVDLPNSSFELRRLIIQSKGQGYGKEAIIGLIDYAIHKRSFHRFWLDVYEDNVTGINLYKSIGMKLDGILEKSYKRDNEFVSQHIYSITNNTKEK